MTVPPLLPPTLKIGRDAHVAIGYTFEDNPHHYLPDAVGTLVDRIASHTSEEVRDILSTLEQEYQQLGGMPSLWKNAFALPVKGVLRFKPHTRRKQQTPLTEKRWSSSGKTDWDVVGGE